jgi:hypothetical protein
MKTRLKIKSEDGKENSEYKPIIRLFVSFLLILSTTTFAGPPFFTDDPQPVDFKHWEFYVASQMNFIQHDADMTAPHIEINYGAIPEIQLHIVAPLGYVKTESGNVYGYRDTEIGVKYRIINTEDGFMAGVFPTAELPTGNASQQLGNGTTQFFLPLWIQKNWGKFQTYCGAGFWINPGTGNKNYSFVGWQAQYEFSAEITLGGELYYKTSPVQDGNNSAGFNLGGYVNISEHHHILFSIGKSVSYTDYTAYAGYQITI